VAGFKCLMLEAGGRGVTCHGLTKGEPQGVSLVVPPRKEENG
jgi:hypothetical protein